MVDGFAGFNLHDNLQAPAPLLSEEGEIGIETRPSANNGDVLLAARIHSGFVAPAKLALQQADHTIVLELLADRPDQNRTQKGPPPLQTDSGCPERRRGQRQAPRRRKPLSVTWDCHGGPFSGSPCTLSKVSTLINEREVSTILVVDDDEGVTQTFARILRLEGYDVRTAMNAETALREADRSHPDAIILDLRMPLVDGLGFLRRLRAHDEQRTTPVAIVTGDYFLDDQVRRTQGTWC